MRFTASPEFIAAARAAGKVIKSRAFIRKTNDITLPLDTGSWQDVSNYVEHPIAEISLEMEIELARFTASGIEISGMDIKFWTGIFNNSHKFIEIKIVCSLSISGKNSTGDEAILFAGIIDTDDENILYDERDDSVTFNARTYDDLGSMIGASTIVTRYGIEDVYGSGHTAIAMQNIPGVYIRNRTDQTGTPTPGYHTIQHRYDDGQHQLRGDEGPWTDIDGVGFTELNILPGGFRRIVAHYDTSLLPTGDQETTANFVSLQLGEERPWNLYQNERIDVLVKHLYEEMGITEVDVSDITLNTYDGRKENSAYQIIQASAQDGVVRCVFKHDDSIYFVVDNSLWKWDRQTEEFSLERETLFSGTHSDARTVRLFKDEGSHHVAFAGRKDNGDMVFRHWNMNTDTHTQITTAISNVDPRTIVWFADKLRLLFISGTEIWRAQFVSFDATSVYSHSDIRDYGCFRSPAGDYYYFYREDSVQGYQIFRIGFDGNDPDPNDVFLVSDTGVQQYLFHNVMINENDGLAYGGAEHPSTAVKTLRSFDPSDGTWSGELSIVERTLVGSFQSNDGLWMHLVTWPGGERGAEVLRVYNNNQVIPQDFPTAIIPAPRHDENDEDFERRETFVLFDDDPYGINHGRFSLLWKKSDTSSMYIGEEANFQGMTVKQAINFILPAFNLATFVSSTKRGKLFKRLNGEGNLSTSGDVLHCTVDDDENLEFIEKYYPAFDYVELSRMALNLASPFEDRRASQYYDGENFLIGNAPDLNDERTFKVTNGMIPERWVPDILHELYEFAKNDHHLLRVSLANVPLYQYEIYDGVEADITGTRLAGKLGNVVNGMILSQRLDTRGGMVFDVLLNN